MLCISYPVFLALLIFSFTNAVPQHHQQEPLRSNQNQGSSALDNAAFDKVVEAAIDFWHVPGMSVAVIDGDQISSKGYGYASLPDVPATPDTLYFTGSTTKAFTAAAVAKLIEDQTPVPGLQWTTPINKLIREDFVLSDDHATTHTTIEDALSHRTGLAGHDLIYGRPGDTPSDVVARLRYLPLTREPRTTFQYCNVMFSVVTELLETMTGMKLEQIFWQKLWEPLGMISTSFYPSHLKRSMSDLARGYWYPGDPGIRGGTNTSKFIPELYAEVAPISGAGSIVSSVNDYALWIKAYLDVANATKLTNASSPINPLLYHSVFTPRTIINQPADPFEPGNDFMLPQLYGLGWGMFKALGHTIIGHVGGLTGFGTNVLILPDDDIGIVTMGNTATTSNIAGNAVCIEVLKKVLGLSVDEVETIHTALAAGIVQQADTLRAQSKPRPSPRPSSEYGIAEQLPLPGNISDYAGTYTHPAYGSIDFHVASDAASAADSTRPPPLSGRPSPSTWPWSVSLHYSTDTLFEARFYTPHGIPRDGMDLFNDTEIVWEHAASTRAVAKFGLPGPGGEMEVETLGVEMVGEMVQRAREEGEKSWKEGMIWFEKV